MGECVQPRIDGLPAKISIKNHQKPGVLSDFRFTSEHLFRMIEMTKGASKHF